MISLLIAPMIARRAPPTVRVPSNRVCRDYVNRFNNDPSGEGKVGGEERGEEWSNGARKGGEIRNRIEKGRSRRKLFTEEEIGRAVYSRFSFSPPLPILWLKGRLRPFFFLNGLPFQPAPRLLWCHGSIDGSMDGSIGGESILITVGRRLFKFSEVREKRSILTHDRARRKRAHSIETIDFAFTQASKGPWSVIVVTRAIARYVELADGLSLSLFLSSPPSLSSAT